jgi:energy-coupling factor transporter ATP-binding protein EcfA2
MTKEQRDDDFLSKRARGITAQRSYDYDVHYYDEKTGEKHLKENAPTEEEWKQQIIDEYSEVGKKSLFCYFIFHDSDMLENGKMKPLHVHIVVKFKNAKRIGSLMKQLGISRIENIANVKTYKGALNYLLHITKSARNDGKFVYSQRDLFMYGEEINSDSKYKYAHFNNLTSDNTDDVDTKEEIERMLQEAVYDVRMNGTLYNTHDICDKFPGDEVMATNIYYNYKYKLDYAENDYFKELAKERSSKGRKLATALISGPGGAGKTELATALANALADERGIHTAPAKSDDKTYDPFNTYEYQKVSILNEIEGGTFSPREFMDVFDPYHYAPISSRTKNVHWLADYVFLTTSKDVTRFRNEMFRYSKGGSRIVDEEMDELRVRDRDDFKDEAYQFTRRIKNNIEIIKKGKFKLINIYAFDDEKYGYRLQKQIKVSNKFYFNKDEMNSVIKDIIYCFEHPEIDVTDGKVKKDVDLIQSKKHIDEFAYYDEEFKFDYKNVSKIDLAKKHRYMLNDLVTDEINDFVERNEEDFYNYIGSVKYKKDDIKSRDDLYNAISTVYEEDLNVWKLEFYDYKNGNIPCVGLSYDEEEQHKTLMDKVKQVKAEKRRNEIINISKHKEFNDKLGVTEDDINKHVENKQSPQVHTNPFDL